MSLTSPKKMDSRSMSSRENVTAYILVADNYHYRFQSTDWHIVEVEGHWIVEEQRDETYIGWIEYFVTPDRKFHKMEIYDTFEKAAEVRLAILRSERKRVGEQVTAIDKALNKPVDKPTELIDK